MENKHFVALDAGSSKIALAVGYENEGKFSVTYYKTVPSAGINKGRIQNAQHASDAIQSLINEANKELELNIQYAVVNYPNYPVEQHTCTSRIERDPDELVQQSEIKQLMTIATNDAISKANEPAKMCAYDCVPQSYSDGMDILISENDIEGRYCDRIEGNFRIYLGKEQPVSMIDNTLGLSGLNPTKKYFTPNYAGKMVLENSDKENGVALVDIGGSVTSVSIFTGGVLRHFDSIPFGGRNVTMDIRNECGLSEHLAENIKKAYGICCPDNLLSMSDKYLRINLKEATRSKEVWVKYLSEIVTARMEEIFNAVLYIIEQSGFSNELRSGIVLTGGGALLCNCGKLLEQMSGYTVRIGKIRRTFSSIPTECQQADAVNCLALLYAAREIKDTQFVIDPNVPRISVIEETEEENILQAQKDETTKPVTAPTPVASPKKAPLGNFFTAKKKEEVAPEEGNKKSGLSFDSIMNKFAGMANTPEEEQNGDNIQQDIFGNGKLF